MLCCSGLVGCCCPCCLPGRKKEDKDPVVITTQPPATHSTLIPPKPVPPRVETSKEKLEEVKKPPVVQQLVATVHSEGQVAVRPRKKPKKDVKAVAVDERGPPISSLRSAAPNSVLKTQSTQVEFDYTNRTTATASFGKSDEWDIRPGKPSEEPAVARLVFKADVSDGEAPSSHTELEAATSQQ